MKLVLFPLLMALAILPTALIGWIISNKAHHSEPGWMLFLLFFLGCVSCIPAALAEELFISIFGSSPNDGFVKIIIYVFFGVAFIEELVKWLNCYMIGFNNKAFDKAYDMIIYAVFASLGFAFIEDLLYIFFNEASLQVAILRAVISIPAHACFSIIMGYFLGLVRYYANKKDRAKEVLYTLLSLLVPALVHAIFDSLLIDNHMLSLFVFFAFVVTINILCFTNANKLYKKNLDV